MFKYNSGNGYQKNIIHLSSWIYLLSVFIFVHVLKDEYLTYNREIFISLGVSDNKMNEWFPGSILEKLHSKSRALFVQTRRFQDMNV